MSLFGRIRNRIAARVLDAVIARVPFFLTEELDQHVKPKIWGHVIHDVADGRPYLTRVLFPRIPAGVPLIGGARPMLHKFHRPDVDRALHSHPWAWAVAVVLAGAYVEERLLIDESNLAGYPITEIKLVRWFNRLNDVDFHRITELRGAVYTLFCAGPRLTRKPAWEFMDSTGRRTPWRTFLDRKMAGVEIGQAFGAALDKIAAVFNVKQLKRGTVELRAGRGHILSYQHETDAQLRERLRAVLNGDTHGNTTLH